jgi:mRNA interferase MazF
MPTFERGTVVRVPFPNTNRPIVQRRPAVVVSDGNLAGGHLLWVVMVTSAGNRAWPGDIGLTENYAELGLPAPSLIRPAKIATIETAHAEAIGKLTPDLLASLDDELRRNLGY